MIEEEGLDNVFTRHKRHSAATRAAVKGWGLETQCQDPQAHSPALTGARMPEGHDADNFRKVVLENFDMSLGTGLNKIKGKAFRIGHIGHFNERMAEICESVNADRSIKAMILTGTGDKAFASGTDISQFRAFKTAQDALDYEARIDRVLGTLEAVRVPTIAAIAGACTGGGAGIAASCDIRIGTETTRIGFPIARTLGHCLAMSNISKLVPLIAPARTKDLIFKARLVEAPEALALGLLNEVVPD